MNADEKASYLANILVVLASDGQIDQKEEEVFDRICLAMQADKELREQARKLAASGKIENNVLSRYSDRVRNLEDMIFAAFCNGEVEASEKRVIMQYAKKLKIEQEQFNLVSQECKQRHHLFQQKLKQNQDRLDSAAIPYGIDKRPMPIREDVDLLLPKIVGWFHRGETRGDIDYLCVSYSDGKQKVNIELGVCSSVKNAQQAVKTAIAESADVCVGTHAASEDTDPSYHKGQFDNPRMGEQGKNVGIVWSRGHYYFSASARTIEALDKFMKEFPY